ncbi:MAG: EthD domain-containing protein [Sphingobium sp.]
MAETQGPYRCVAVLETSSSADMDALHAAWAANDPFGDLASEGVTRYVRGFAVATDDPVLLRRGRIGIAHLFVPDAATALVLNVKLRAGEVHGRHPQLGNARIIAMPLVQRFRLGVEDDFGQTPLRAIYLVKGRDDIGPTGFHDHWRGVHGPLLIGQAGVTRYAQNHRLTDSYDAGPEFDGLAEMSFPDEAANAVFSNSEPHRTNQVNDLPNAFDLNVGKRFYTREETIFG